MKPAFEMTIVLSRLISKSLLLAESAAITKQCSTNEYQESEYIDTYPSSQCMFPHLYSATWVG